LSRNVDLQLNVFDSAVFEPLEVKITTQDLVTGEQLNPSIRILDKGRYIITLPIGHLYHFTFENEYYKTGTLDFDLSGTVIYSKFEKDVELVPLKKRVVLHVVDVKSGKGIITEVEVVNLTTHKKYKTYVKTDPNGNVVLYLRKGDVYELNITPKGYTFFNTKLDLEEDTVTSTEIVAKVEPLTQQTKIEFHNITFETNSAELNEESFQELDRLVELMKKNPNIKVEISAHTDDVGSEAYNMKLSLRRAQAVVNYLKEHGIPEGRMIARGYGETRPLVPNDSEEHRAMNRRVELRILEINNSNE
jgi:outer membrane protein OmpA-like peptidoglycan-associated protein